jgi:hypothetical protein
MNNLKKKGGEKGVAAKKVTQKKQPKMKPAETAQQRKGGILVEAAFNVEEQAKKISKKASKIAEKGTTAAGGFYDKLKGGLTDVYEFGIKLADEISENAQEYIEKYKYTTEMKKLSDEKNKLLIKLGSLIYLRSKMRNIKSEDILKNNGIDFIMNEIDKKNKDIIKVGKKLEEAKK